MELTSYVETLRRDLAVAAEAGGDDARALAERLTAPLEASIRLMLLDALSAAADDITRELAPGSVELRLRGGEPEFVVSAAPADEPAAAEPPAPPAEDDGPMARINLRLPEQLKAAAEQAAARERLSVNAWLVRAVAAAATGPEAAPPARRPDGPGLHRMGAMTFESPGPITANLDVVVGDVRIAAGERADTVVDVRPSDPSNQEDTKAAEQTRVEFEQGHLLVKTPKLRSLGAPQPRRLGRRDRRAAAALAPWWAPVS